MGANYVDDHRILLIQDGETETDITAFCQNVELDDELTALSRTLTFTVYNSVWDKYTPKLAVAPGNTIRVVNHDNEVFSGRVETVTLEGEVTVNDPGYTLNESEIIFQCTNVAVDTAIKQMCAKAEINIGEIAALPTQVTALWTGETPAKILEELLDTCMAATGKQYYSRIEGGKLYVRELPSTSITAYHKPNANIAAFDITWALGAVSGEDSADGLINSVLIAAENDGKVYTGAEGFNAGSIVEFGLRQLVETVDEDPGTAQLQQQVTNLLSQGDRVTSTRTIEEIWGADEVTSGVILSFNSAAFGIEGQHRVTRVTHMYGNAGHTMALELQALEQLRAVPSVADTIKVTGFPAEAFASAEDDESASSDEYEIVGGKKVNAEFTAYWPSNTGSNGGYYAANGEKLDPSKMTCAGPESIPHGTMITVQDTKTVYDGKTYRKNDHGGAIVIKNGVYHFDLLMSSETQCNNFGRRPGTAIIGGTKKLKSSSSSSAASGSAAKFVSVAESQIGYKETGDNINKYGAEFGRNGQAWCVFFVSWCAKYSGAPIPYYGFVGDVSDYFKARGKYKSVGSGYTPKAGDLMIQGVQHIGIVTSATRSSVQTIEGNTTNSVKRMTRYYSEITGFCTPWG